MNKYIGIILASAFLLSGCYHAQVTTGLEASGEVYEKEWAHGFIYGLVPPDMIDGGQQCTSGVARVETKLSFLNQLASIISFGIYTPMHITVTCAASGAELHQPEHHQLDVAGGADEETVRKVFDKAAAVSAESKAPVYIHFK